MLFRNLLVSSSTLVAAIAFLFQAGQLNRELLNGCEIDLRPKSSPEAQVYWADAASGQFGMKYSIDVPLDDTLVVGAWDGSGEHPLVTNTINTVTFVYDTVTKKLSMTIVSDSTYAVADIPFTGTFDPIGSLVQPTETEVRTGTVNKEIKRLRFTGTNYGLTYSFTMRGVK